MCRTLAWQIDGLVQERGNYIANELELCLALIDILLVCISERLSLMALVTYTGISITIYGNMWHLFSYMLHI